MRAVLFDLGGVVISSPMAEFGAYERRNGFPDGLIRQINSTNPDTNAWARWERAEVDEDGFVRLFEAEARARGYEVDGTKIVAMLEPTAYPRMVAALHRLREAGFVLAAVTNNMSPMGRTHGVYAEFVHLFDVVVESSVERIRKPEPAFYELALARLGIPASECVYLDDLGINLKPARAMGMTTIKVIDPDEALRELGDVLGLDPTA